jgi:hypothetical protein
MKRVCSYLLLGVVLLTFSVLGCEENAAGASTTNKFTINGDDFINDVVVGSGDANVLVGSNATQVRIQGIVKGQEANLQVIFNGTTPGTYPWLSSGDVTLTLSNSGRYIASGGTTTITEVGNIGGYVVGTFEGTLINSFDQSRTMQISGQVYARIY